MYADDGIEYRLWWYHHSSLSIETVFITHILYARGTFADPSSVLGDLAVAGDKAEQPSCRRLLLYS